jgi:lysyl-tRNA synthetase class 1
MRWLTTLVDNIIAAQPEGEILIESGASPSGTYHMGHLREIVTCDAILLELRRRGRNTKHVQYVDDLDALRKIPVNIPVVFEQHLGKPLCDIPAPDGSDRSYGDYFLTGFEEGAKTLGIEMEVIRSHEKYRSGYFVPAIERVLSRLPEARNALETISGRKLDEHWSPIQVMEDGYLKNRAFVALNNDDKTIVYKDNEGNQNTVKYDAGKVKLDWRLDWPGRWWLMKVNVEPFGRDHASAGGSFDTGKQIMQDIYEAPAPIPVPYDFINRAGDTKKMSASKGTGIAADEAVRVLPPEVLRYFILSSPPEKRLYFDPVDGVVKLVDEFAELLAKSDKSPEEEMLLQICRGAIGERIIVSRVPFSHLVTSYQAALKDPEATLQIISRTEHNQAVEANREIIKEELKFIDAWLENWAPEEVKFVLQDTADQANFNEMEIVYFRDLADKIESAPEDADGEWFHKAIYEFKDQSDLQPKELFTSLYRLLISKDSGPRAGWFLSLLSREWLLSRLRFET